MAYARRIHWNKLEGLKQWMKQAKHWTDDELFEAVRKQYGKKLSDGQMKHLRAFYGGKQTLETFHRALVVRSDKQRAPKEDKQVTSLKQINASLMRQLSEAKARVSDLVNAVYRAAMDAAANLDLPPIPPPAKLTAGPGKEEVAIAVLSDWQLAKRTATYDTKVCEERIEIYGNKVLRLVEIQRAAYPVKELRVYLLGDLIEGELIFPGQSYLVDASLYRQVMVDGPRILGNFLRKMLTKFERVHVVGVIGNHGALGGRSRREYHPETNADAMMYEATRLTLANESRLTWNSNVKKGERNWYAVDYIGRNGFLLFHGDQVKGGFAGFPWYGFAKKIQGWAMGAIREKFHYALAGHFHTPTRMLIGKIILWVSGSTESDNTYAAEMLAAQGTPSQWLFFCRPDKERGITCEYQVHLADNDKERGKR